MSRMHVVSFALLSILPSFAAFAESDQNGVESIRHVYNMSQQPHTVVFNSNQMASAIVEVPAGEDPCQVTSTPVSVTYTCSIRPGEMPLTVHYELGASGKVSLDNRTWNFAAKGNGVYIYHSGKTQGVNLNDPANGDITIVD